MHPGQLEAFRLCFGTLEKLVGAPALFFGQVSNAVLLPHSGMVCTSDRAFIYRGLAAEERDPAENLGSEFLAGPTIADKIYVDLPPEAPFVDHECIYIGGNQTLATSSSRSCCVCRLQILFSALTGCRWA